MDGRGRAAGADPAVLGVQRSRDVSHAIYHDDAVLEFAQFGERSEGVANFKEWRGQYPAGLASEMRDLRGEGDL